MSTDVDSVNNDTEHGRRRRRPRRRDSTMDECRFPEIEMNRVSDSSSEDDNDDDDVEVREYESECRICHLNSTEEDVIELGCSCKGKLGTAHKHCAETWFKIKRNTTCEICSSEAVNITIVVQNEAVVVVGGDDNDDDGDTNATSATVGVVVVVPAENGEGTWNGRRIMNTLLACIIMSFVMSWLFHLRMLSSSDNL